ncbi:beta strand repeat-containing protein [Marinibactrum halimedae]|uniref:Filamentous haemagglutinin FhaB/tRNA nuclease CdiA-like TPS domain-containing protein n=1 Tax=Marinibactrum halimedae TaxID=1444977 RepID=A0AA37T388_9GAMM|nr:filamentous hemagglutinin N-terminal domain-containing protein [Marinibactrum halimedae]MCD9459646.1 filamentous hemagglutinin N-terminal domain-containing protein [Marinibactrum halimedae]GLS25673.1 hypothetical protein GCM10007877_13870 [Marinibactrum halimedae]
MNYLDCIKYSGCFFLGGFIVVNTKALPQGHQVVVGDVQVTMQQNQMQVEQSSQHGIIEFTDFDIAENELVRFQQPNSQAITLNRVVGNSPSDILGQLQSNGQILLVNPNGVFFSETAQLDVGSLITSTLDIRNDDFLQNQLTFEGDATATIENRGVIRTRGEGFIALVSNNIHNSGELQAERGSVGLLAGERVVVGFEGESVAFDVTAASTTADIHNTGNVIGGVGVTVDANSFDAIENVVINNEGVIQATGFEVHNGEIVISSSAGAIINSGVVSADGDALTQTSTGVIDIDSERFANLGEITADAQGNGAGGNIDIYTTDALYLADGSLTSANGAGFGDGGRVIQYSEGAAWFAPEAYSTAMAGTEGGNGGFIEVSGRQFVSFEGMIDTTSENGENGTVFIDPVDISIMSAGISTTPPAIPGGTIELPIATSFPGITTISPGSLNRLLSGGSNVIISTAVVDVAGNSGVLSIDEDIDLTGISGQTLTFQSNGDMNINANICEVAAGGGCARGGDNVNLFFETIAGDGGSISVADGTLILSDGGTIDFNSDADITLGRNSLISSAGGNLNFTANNTLTWSETGNASLADLTIRAGDLRDASDRLLNIISNSIDIALSNPSADLSIQGSTDDLNVSFGVDRNFTFFYIPAFLSTGNTFNLNNIDLAGGDFSAFITPTAGIGTSDFNLVNVSNVTNLSLINSSDSGSIFLPGGISVPGDVVLQSAAIQNANIAGSRSYFVQADSLDLTTQSLNGQEIASLNVNELALNFSAAAIADRLVINEANDIVIIGLVQDGVNDLSINATGDITFATQVDLSNVGDAAVSHRFSVESTSGSIFMNADLADTSATQNTNTEITLDAANNVVISDNVNVDSGGASIEVTSGGDLSIGQNALIDSGDAVQSLTANRIVNNGTLRTAATDEAIRLTSATSLVGGNGSVIQAENGRARIRTQTGVDVITSVNALDIENSVSGAVVINETDSLVLTNMLSAGDTTVSINAGSDININADLRYSSPSQTVGTSVVFDAGRNLSVANGVSVSSQGGDIRISADDVTVGESSTVDTGSGLLSIEASQLIHNGTLNSTSQSNRAIAITSASDITTGNTGVIQAQNGGAQIRSQTGVDIITNVDVLDIENSVSGDINVNEMDSLTLMNMLASGDASFSISTGDSLNVNTNLRYASPTQTSGSTITFNTGGDLAVANGIALASEGGNINFTAGGTISTGESALIDVGNASLSLSGNEIIHNGILNSTSQNASAILLNSNSAISTGTDGIVQAQNGGVQVQAQTGINLSTNVAVLNVENTTSGIVRINEASDVRLENLLSPGDTALILESGTLTLPDDGISTPGRLTLSADSIVSDTSNSLLVAANELILSANAATNTIGLNSSVNTLDATVLGAGLSIQNSGSLRIADLSGDGNALVLEDGNLDVLLNSGDLALDDRLAVTDMSADGERTGMMRFRVDSGDITLGGSGTASLEANSTLDSTLPGLTNGYSDNAIIVFDNNDTTSPTAFTIGSVGQGSVDIRLLGGDFVADLYKENPAEGEMTESLSSITLQPGTTFRVERSNGNIAKPTNVNNSDANHSLNQNLLNEPGSANVSTGILLADGVDTSPAEFSIADGSGVYLIVKAQSTDPLTPDLSDILSDVYPANIIGGSSVAVSSINRQSGIDGVDAVLGYGVENCDVLKEEIEKNQCRVDQTFHRFFNTFLISGQLPSMVLETL